LVMHQGIMRFETEAHVPGHDVVQRLPHKVVMSRASSRGDCADCGTGFAGLGGLGCDAEVLSEGRALPTEGASWDDAPGIEVGGARAKWGPP